MVVKGRCRKYKHASKGCKACKRGKKYTCNNCEVSIMTLRESCYSCINREKCHDYQFDRNINV